MLTNIHKLLEMLQKVIKLLVLYSILNIIVTPNIYAEDQPKGVLETIVDVLENLTCETKGMGDLLIRSEFSHTCVPAPFFTVAVATILGPFDYLPAMLRLKINDHELFDEQFPGGQCARNNKADYKNPTLTFALCNNAKLAKVRFNAIKDSAFIIAKAALTGTEPWNEILEKWQEHKKDYHQIETLKPGEGGFMLDVGIPPSVPVVVLYYKVVQFKDMICFTVPGIFNSGKDLQVGCKYIQEPYPNSIYQSFISPDTKVTPDKESDVNPLDPMAIVDCGLASTSCYQRAYNNSKTAIVITAPLIECMKEMTARLLVSRDVCTFDEINQVINSNKRETSILFQFQRNMHKFVTALLALYVVFFGFKIMMSAEAPPRKEIINFVLKMLFVTYFSVGININSGSSNNNDYGRLDGMVELAFPFLLGGIDTLAGWVMNATPSGLCDFSDVTYDPKLSYMSLWDALDCRVSHYLGLDILSTMLVESQSKKFDFFSFSAPPYVYLLIPAIISGSMTLISLALAYPLLVISVAAFMINATIMCMISIVILGVLAPLFVPMFLFDYTRGYFESWVKLLISFLLQPMVVTTFMLFMFTVYDFGFYGNCKYMNKMLDYSIESSLINGEISKRKVKIFAVDQDWDNYKSDEDVQSCKNSLGYILNNPWNTVVGFAKDSLDKMVKEKPGTTSTKDHMGKFDFLQGIEMSPGMFFEAPKLLFEKIKTIILALITACFTLYLMYHFSAQLAEFAADMTEGVALNNVAINPQLIFKAGMAAASAAAGAAGGAATGGASAGGDMAATAGRKAGGDMASAAGGTIGDMVSTSRGGTGGGSGASGGSGDMASSAGDSSAGAQSSQYRVATTLSSGLVEGLTPINEPILGLPIRRESKMQKAPEDNEMHKKSELGEAAKEASQRAARESLERYEARQTAKRVMLMRTELARERLRRKDAKEAAERAAKEVAEKDAKKAAAEVESRDQSKSHKVDPELENRKLDSEQAKNLEKNVKQDYNKTVADTEHAEPSKVLPRQDTIKSAESIKDAIKKDGADENS